MSGFFSRKTRERHVGGPAIGRSGALSLMILVTALTSQAEQLAWPTTEWSHAARPDWSRGALDELFAYSGEQASTALLIVQHGELIVERYWPAPADRRFRTMLAETTADARTLEDVASVQKSVVSTLVAMAAARGMLDPDATISSYLPGGWSNAGPAESGVTIAHLLSMTSGLTPSLEREAEPGSRWRYNTNAYSRLLDVLEAAAGSDINTITAEWLTGPLAMTETDWRPREWLSGDEDANRLGLVSSARDLARFGLFVLRDGVWQGQRLVPADALRQARVPSQALNPAYGQLWWLNGQPFTSPSGSRRGALSPAAPGDLTAALGALGRKIYLVPSLDMVVVRLGDQPESGFDRTFWKKLMAVVPEPALCRRCDEPLAFEAPEARSADGQPISWREHIIDDPGRGVPDLSGSDGLAMADLDGDGFDDIVSVHESDTVYDGKPIGHVRIAWGSADPTRWSYSTLASGTDAAAAEDVSIADANGDGHPDVIVACELAHLIYFQNPGMEIRGSRWPRTIPSVTRNRGSYIRVFFADLDGDGRPEVSAANKGAQNPGELADPEPSAFSIYHLPADPLNGDDWREQVLGLAKVPINAEPVDLDGDGDLDIVAGSRRERRLLWFENEGGFHFSEHPIAVPDAPEDLAITGFNMDYADLDGDDRKDIVSTAWPGSLVLLSQPEDPAQPWGMRLIGATPPDQLVSVRLADVDDDGDLDAFSGAYSRGPRDQDGPLLTVNDPLGRIVWFENRGSDWRSHTISRRKRGMYDKWLLRDLDGDGDLDAIGTRGNSEPYDGVIWLEQQRGPAEQVFTQARAIDSQQMGPAEAP